MTIGVGTIFIGTAGSETEYNYSDISLLQTHPQEDPDAWEAVIDAAYDDVSYGDSVLIKRDGTTIFAGYVDTIEPRFEKGAGLLVYVSGPCWKGAMDRRIIEHKMVGSGSDDFDKSAFVKCYPDELLKFIFQLPQNDVARLDPEVREGEGIYKDGWTIYIPCVVSLAAAGYTNCVAGDLGKDVLDDGGATGTLLAYNNTGRLWYVDYTGTVAAGSAMTIDTGTGAGTSEGTSVYAGGAARKDKMMDRENEAYGSNWYSSANQTANHTILIDLGGIYHISGIRVECRADRDDFPTDKRCVEYMRNYEIFLSALASGTWESVASDSNNMARDVIHGIDPTDANEGQSKRWLMISITADFATLWAVTEIYVYKSGDTPYTNRLPVTEGTVDVFGNSMPPVNIDDYMSIAQIFQIITDLTTCPEGGDDATISEVLLGFTAKRTAAGDAIEFRTHIWTGATYEVVATWNSNTDLTASYADYETDITAKLDTLAKINAARLKFDVTAAGAASPYVRITYAYMKVTIDSIQYVLDVRGRIAGGTQEWTSNGYDPWLEFNDTDTTYIQDGGGVGAVGNISQGYLFLKQEGNRPWEWWVDPTAKTWNFQRRRGSDLSGSVEFKYDSTGVGGHFEKIEKSGHVAGILNRIKVIAGGEGIDQEVNSSAWTEDTASITANGLYEGTIDEPAIDNKDAADVYAKVLLAEHKNPRNTIRVRVYDSFVSNTWGVGDEITLTDTHTGLSGKYRVMSLKRTYGPDGEVVTIVASDSSTYLPKFRPSEEVLDFTARGLPKKSGGWLGVILRVFTGGK